MFYLSHTVAIRMLFYFATTLSENSITNALKFRKLISLSESGSQNRVLELGIINQIRSARYCSLLMVTGRYSTLQHVTARYRSLLLIPSFSNNDYELVCLFVSIYFSVCYKKLQCSYNICNFSSSYKIK